MTAELAYRRRQLRCAYCNDVVTVVYPDLVDAGEQLRHRCGRCGLRHEVRVTADSRIEGRPLVGVGGGECEWRTLR